MKLNKLLKLDMETAYVPVAKLKDVQEMMSNWRENNRRIRIFSFLTCTASFFSAMNFIYDKETPAAIASFLTLFIFLLSGIFVNANKRFVYFFPVLGVMVFSLAPEHYVDLTIRTFFMITVFLPALISSIFAYKALYNYKNVFIPLSKRKGFPNFVFSTADMYADKIYEKEKDTKTVAEKRVEASFNPFNEQQNVTDEEIARMNSLRYEELKTHNQDIFMGAYYESKEVKHTADEEKTYKYGKSIFGFNFIIPHNEIKGAKKADNREVMWHWNEMKSKMFVGEENWLTYFVIVIMIYMWTTPSVSGFLMFVFLALHILGTNYIKQDKLIGFPLVLCIYLYLTIPSLANYVVIGLFTVFRMPRIIRWLCNLPIYNKLSKEPGFPSFIETTADLYGDQLYIREEPKPVVKRTKIEPIVMDIGYDEEEDKKSFRELRRLSEFNYQEQNKDNGSLREDSSWNAFNYLETDEQNSAYDEFAIYEEVNRKRREAELKEEFVKPNKEMGRKKKDED